MKIRGPSEGPSVRDISARASSDRKSSRKDLRANWESRGGWLATAVKILAKQITASEKMPLIVGVLVVLLASIWMVLEARQCCRSSRPSTALHIQEPAYEAESLPHLEKGEGLK